MKVSSDKPRGATLLDVGFISQLLGCSARHVYRLADSGKMPAPVKLGDLTRWRLDEIEAWIADGCKPVREVTAKGGAK